MAHPGCPDPASCPVVEFAAVRRAPHVTIPAGGDWVRCYDATWGFDEPNPGFGDTRFAPFRDDAGCLVPTMYLAENDVGALLETVFHDVDPGVGLIYEDTLQGRLLAYLTTPTPLTMVDLRDPSLAALRVDRGGVVSSNAEHYPCTRNLARQFYDHNPAVAGLIWHSRQAEFQRALGRLSVESAVAVVFADRAGIPRGHWCPVAPGIVSLGRDAAAGRTRVDQIADLLDIDVITS